MLCAEHLGFTQVAAHMIAENVGIKRLLDSTGLSWTTSTSQWISDWTATLPALG